MKQGVKSLQELLKQRKEEEKDLGGEDKEEVSQSIEAIKMWLERMTKLRAKVNGETPVAEGVKPTTPSVQPTAITAAEADTAESMKGNLDAEAPLSHPNSPLANGVDEVEAANVSGLIPSSPASPRTTTPSDPGRAEAPTLPSIHLRALEKSRRAGSLSGLSVSDARIETEDSASDSESDSGSDTGSSGSSESSSDSESESETSPSESIPSDPEASLRHIFSQPLSQKQQRKARQSAASMPDVSLGMSSGEDGASESSGQTASPVQRAVREGSESSIGDFLDGRGDDNTSSQISTASDEVMSEIKPISEPPSLLPPPRDSLSTSNNSTGSDAPEHSLIPPAESSSSGSRRSSGRFAELDQAAEESLAVDNLPGARALQEAIEEDRRPELEAGVLVQESSGRESQKDKAAKVVRGLPSPPSSVSEREPEVATQLTNGHAAAPRGGRGAKTLLVPESQPANSTSVSANHLAARGTRSSQRLTSPLPLQTPPRRTRSVSAMSQDEPLLSQSSQTPRQIRRPSVVVEASPIQRSTRASSRADSVTRSPQVNIRGGKTPQPDSQASGLGLQVNRESLSPQQVSICSAGSIEADRLQSKSKRSHHSSHVDQLSPSHSLPPIEESQDAQEIPFPSVTPARSTRRSARSPLFVSQGSQAPIPQTQAYNAFPPSSSLITPTRPTQGEQTATVSSPNADETPRADGQPEPIIPPPSDRSTPSDAEAESQAEDEDESVILPAPPRQLPPLPTASQPQPTFPLLSNLSKEVLRAGRSTLSSAFGAFSQPAVKTAVGMGGEESSSEESDSSEDEVPADLKGRFAGEKKKKVTGVIRGW